MPESEVVTEQQILDEFRQFNENMDEGYYMLRDAVEVLFPPETIERFLREDTEDGLGWIVVLDTKTKKIKVTEISSVLEFIGRRILKKEEIE